MKKIILFCCALVLCFSAITAPSKKLLFKAAPAVSPGESLWSLVVPKFQYKQGQDPSPQIQVIVQKNETKPPNKPEQKPNITFDPLNSDPCQGRDDYRACVIALKKKGRLLKKETPNQDAIRDYIWPWMENNKVEEEKNEIIERQFIQKKENLFCYENLYQFINPNEDILNLKQSLDVLYPGSFVQGKSVKTGSQPMQKLPISHVYRNPIIIAGQGNFQPQLAKSSEAGDVLRKIREAIWKSQGYYSSQVFVKMCRSDQLGEFIRQLNINSGICSVLGIRNKFEKSKAKKIKTRFYIALVQGIAQFFAEKKVFGEDKAINDAVGLFLKDNYSVKQIKRLESLGYIGENNIPSYVDQVTYGRVMFVSVEETKQSREIYQKIKNELSSSSSEVENYLSKIFRLSTSKVISIGGFQDVEVRDLTSGRWTKFFEAIPANSPLVESLKPIKYRVRYFNGQNIKASNKLRYTQRQCQEQQEDQICPQGCNY